MDIFLTEVFWQKFLLGFLPFYVTGLLGGLWRTIKWLIYVAAVTLFVVFAYSYTASGLLRILTEIWGDLQKLGLPGFAGVVAALLLAPPTVRAIKRRRRPND